MPKFSIGLCNIYYNALYFVEKFKLLDMYVLYSVLSFFALEAYSHDALIDNDYTGEWEYSVIGPDLTYKGIMKLDETDGEISGSLNSEGVKYEMTEVKLEGDILEFRINVGGFVCDVKGIFENDDFEGEVSVEGYSLPMKAKRIMEE